MGKKTGIGVVIGVVIIILLISSFLKGDPIDLTVSFGCIGGSHCLVGEVLKLNVKIDSHEETLTNQNKSINIISDAIQGGKIASTAVIGSDTQLSIPLKLSLQERRYKVKVTSDLINTGGFFDKILLGIKYFFYDAVGKKYTYTEEIEVRYPIVKSASVGYDCKDKGFYIGEIKLKLEDDKFQEFRCKIRIYTNQLVSTNHALLKESSFDAQMHFYDSNSTLINKKDLSGSIQKVSFNADPAVQQIDTKIVPVCLVGENEVEIQKYEEKLVRCNVNKKPFW